MKDLNFNATNSKYAKASRSSMEKVLLQNTMLQGSDLVDEVFAKIPLMFQIVNEDRQVVYINQLLEKKLKENKIEYSLGYRAGEILSCTNAFVEEGGCGTSEMCRYCNIINCIIESLTSNSLCTKEVAFVSEINGKQEVTNFIVTTKPFLWKTERFVIINFENISEKKRKEQLERTFFHDLMNKVNSIYGLSEILKEDEDLQENQFISMIRRGIFDLVDEIRFQHNLVNAEKDELAIKMVELNNLALLKQMKEDFIPWETSQNKKVNISKSSQIVHFMSDSVIVKRCLTNLVKNALEAIDEGKNIEIGSTKTDGFIRFWVKNDLVLSEEIKSKIFTRTFSTKGDGRGIGTYSVKLFTEKYLNGKAYFTSDNQKGTVFYLEYPLD